MMGVLSVLWLASLLGWLAFAVLGFGLQAYLSVPLGLAVGLGVALVLRDSVALRGIVALLGPVGVVLPFLILRQMSAHFGVAVQPFGAVELLVFAALYIAFLASAAGVIPVDVYRLGYAPIPVAVIVLALCSYGFAQGMVFVPLLAVAGQMMWVAGWGSSNYFDHVLHPVLVPVIAVVLVMRLF